MKRLILLMLGLLALLAALFLELPQPGQPALTQDVEKIVIDKSDRLMQVYADGRAVKTYAVALGFAPEGDKAREGDGRTPEGTFRVDRRNGQSRYHLSLGLDYPQPEDRARADAGGYDPGGDIFIHGQPKGIAAGMKLAGDWTAGCIAVSNAEIEELFAHVALGTLVEIRP